MSDKRDFILGAIFGQAIGDALGHPIEFKKTHKVVDLPIPSLFTDDTQMFCAIGEALLDSPPHIDEDQFMVTLSQKFDEWRHNPLGGSHRAPGGNCMDAVRKLGAGVPWQKAGGLDFKGNGSAMRSGIVGAYYWKDPDYAFRIGALTSVCTHNNLEALLGAGMVAYLVAACIKHGNFPRAVADGLLKVGDFGHSLPFYPRNVKFGWAYDEQNPWYASSTWGAAFALGDNSGLSTADAVNRLIDRENIVVDGAVVPAVAEAIFFNSRFDIDSSTQYYDVVLEAVNNSDDTDTIGAITGTIAGARVGLDGIYGDWVQRIELADYLRSLGERIDVAVDRWAAAQEIDELAAEITAEAIADEIEIDLDMNDGLGNEEDVVYCKHNRPSGRCSACGTMPVA